MTAFGSFVEETPIVSLTAPAPAQTVAAMAARGEAGPLRMMYGETYDRFGPTFDALKYYCWLAVATGLLGADGTEVRAEVVVADTATTRNAAPDAAEGLLRAGATHAERMNHICAALGLPVEVVLQSSFIDGPAFAERLEEVRKTYAASAEAAESIRQTVPERFREAEETKGWVYALEEVATIAPYDLKVGPPREQFYDNPARVVAGVVGWKPLCSVFLTPALPLGLPPSTFVRDKELAQFGVTPYKAGSLGMQANRLLLGPTVADDARRLLAATAVVPKPGLPNPLLEFANTCDLIRWAVDGERPKSFASERFFAGEAKKDDLVADCVATVELVAARVGTLP